MIGRFLGFATDTASSFVNLFGRSDIQQRSVDRTAGYFGALSDEVEVDEACPACDYADNGWCACRCHAAPQDPSDTNASASRAVSDEGPVADSDIPPVAATGHPINDGPPYVIGRDFTLGERHDWRCEREYRARICQCAERSADLATSIELANADRTVSVTVSTPDTLDLNGDPEFEAALAACNDKQVAAVLLSDAATAIELACDGATLHNTPSWLQLATMCRKQAHELLKK
jgi:hypothetical protein